MTYGFTITSSTTGRNVVEQDYTNPPLISVTTYQPSAFGVSVSVPYGLLPELPLIFARPQVVDRYVGGLLMAGANSTLPANTFQFFTQCPVDIAIFSTQGSPVSDGSTWGLEIFRSSGARAFSSRYTYPRMTSLAPKPLASAYPWSFSTPGYSSMPWIFLNNLIFSDYSMAMAKVATGYQNVVVDIRDVEAFGTDPASWYASTGNTNIPYTNTVHFGAGTF